jgi:hypothetical protein
MAGDGDAIIAPDQERMEATVKQECAMLESSIADDPIYPLDAPGREEGEPDRRPDVRP